MAATICPTVTAQNEDEYKEQIERIAGFALRIHIDISDGKLSPVNLIPPDQIWWPGGIRADIHVMYENPFEYMDVLMDLGPQMIIVHAEAKGDFISFAKEAHNRGIEVGIALEPHTSPELIRPAIEHMDYALIFSGNLGHFGGRADLRLITKVKHLKKVKPSIEIGWDGGINEHNARALAMSGVDVLNVGGFIQNSENPQASFEALEKLVVE